MMVFNTIVLKWLWRDFKIAMLLLLALKIVMLFLVAFKIVMLLLVVFLPLFQLQERVHIWVKETTRLYETLE